MNECKVLDFKKKPKKKKSNEPVEFSLGEVFEFSIKAKEKVEKARNERNDKVKKAYRLKKTED